MKRYSFLGILFFLLFTSLESSAGIPAECLKRTDPLSCLATETQLMIDRSKDSQVRAEEYGDLLVTLAEAGHRQDSIYVASEKVLQESGTMLSQWQLMLGRYTYALAFSPELATSDIQNKIFFLAELLDKRLDPTDTLTMVISACAAREALASNVRNKWRSFLDDQCRSDVYDFSKLEEDDAWLWVSSAPLIDAYNRDKSSFIGNMISSSKLSRFYNETARSVKRRSAVEALIYASLFAKFLRAYALGILDPNNEAKQAVLGAKKDVDLITARPNPSSLSKDMLLTIRGMVPGMLARVGLLREADTELRKLLSNLGRTSTLSVEEMAEQLSLAVEAQSFIQKGLAR